MQVLICEKCGLIHSIDYDGLTCRNENCGGKLLAVEMDFSYTERGNHNQPETELGFAS